MLTLYLKSMSPLLSAGAWELRLAFSHLGLSRLLFFWLIYASGLANRYSGVKVFEEYAFVSSVSCCFL